MNYVKTPLFLLITFLIVIGCNTKKKEASSSKEKEATQIKKKKPKRLQKGCYVYNDNKSTISLQVMEKGDSITGTLLFALAEKDKNTGRFKGYIKNNVLLADYTFESEGVESVRQVAFRVKNDTLLQGYGPMELKNATQVFQNPSSLTFDAKFPLVKKACVD
ncbi:hypothetical protein [Marixanthomonas ophiurae]|uniref:Copper resistance protein NlpE n=1 Tax=Marixanthomonas ophiurae TaxID=387659 RepID=A0A3E1Q7M9_9FLAO|nr:hypothetical protein [Marixanthomonas ophiurae]RFN58147.1 hypothetical protein DZ858_13010 [Marixanthomonas ophiurae]